MIDDARELPDGCRLAADVCVIGSGPAGTTVTRGLLARGLNVLLLEAGGKKSEPAAEDALRGEPGDGFHDPLEKVRQRRLGGTSAQWGGRCFPFDELDFAARPGLRGGWPITRAELEPWYREAAEVLQLGAFEFDLAAAVPGAPRPLDRGPDPKGDIDDSRVWRWSPPVRFWRDYGRDLAHATRLRILHHAPVVRLEQERPGGPVTSARISLGGGHFAAVRAQQFVVAGGGLETARLLLASNVGDAGGQLGRNYMVHPLAEVGAVLGAGPALLAAGGYRVSHDGVWVRSVLTPTPELLAAEGLPSIGLALWYPDPTEASHGDSLLSSYALVRSALARHGGFKGTGMHRRYADLDDPGAHVRNVAGGLPDLGRYFAHWTRHRWLGARTLPSFSRTPAGATYRLRFDAEQLPDSENRVELSRDTDAHGVPRLVVHHKVTGRDRELIHRALVRAAEELTATGAADVTPPTRDELDALPLNDGTHQMGLARMASRPEEGVVDADCRIFGAPNTWVAGSAVFPTAGLAGPTMTIVALAARLAARIGTELGR